MTSASLDPITQILYCYPRAGDDPSEVNLSITSKGHMTTFNSDEIFNTLLAKIENGDIKTTHQLRLILDDLSEEFNISPLSLLVTFREWLLMKNIELSTGDGVVRISRVL